MNNSYENELPKHMPVDMALAPDQKPYKHTHVIHAPKEEQTSKLAQHSLSPEKLGLVGYVKDVAGFVKDVVSDRRDKKQQQHQQQVERRNSTSSVHSTSNTAEDNQAQRRNSTNSHTAFIDTVTGLFPGVNTTTTTGCTHAEELRHQMMKVNEQQEVIHKHKRI